MPPPAARPALLLAAIVLLLGLAGCGGGGTSTAGGGAPPAATPGGTAIVIKNFAFTPASLTVAPGATITVTNQDSAIHTVTADDKAFDTGSIAAGKSMQLTAPSKPGSYPFHCTPHPFMTGTLTVT